MAATASLDPFLVDAATYLCAAVITVPIFKRLKLGSVVGYLVAGAIIGPYGLGLIEDTQSVLHFAEFGVVLLLFVIGLELEPTRLWRLRSEIFGLGLLQVVVTAAALFGLIWWSQWVVWQSAVVIGGALALSSTAFAVQFLRERGDLAKPYGDRAFSILLFQDLAIVPMLALVAILSPWQSGTGDPLNQALIAVGAICGVIVVGHYGLRPLFRLIAATRANEIFTAAALLVVIGAALAMQMAGLSMAMGAFLAGVLLAESEFKHQLESDIEPFRGLLLGLLFIAVGMSVAWPLIAKHWMTVVFGALILFGLKALVIYGLTRLFGSPHSDSIRISTVLGQGGEFGFVLFTVATTAGLLTQRNAFILTALVTLTMALTPVAVAAVDWWRRRNAKKTDMSEVDHVSTAEAGEVIIVGFGRFGQIVARVLDLRGYSVTLIDNSPERIRIARTFGNKVFFGDVRRGDVLSVAGAGDARAVFLCADDVSATVAAAQTMRERFPDLLIFARASDRVAELELRKVGVNVVVREMLESSVSMARRALETFGDGEIADEIIEEFRRRDSELLRLQGEFGAQLGYEKLRKEFSLKENNT